MKLFPQSNFNDGHTILQKLQELSKFLHDHPVYNSFFINSPWQKGASNVQYSNNAILNLSDRKVSVGDLVLFNNAYYGVITNVGDGTFIVGTAISFAGPKGETGPAGQNGANGENGIGISSIIYKDATDDGNVYIINMTDGSTYEFTAPKGPQGNTGATGATGPKGETGNGIANVSFLTSSESGNTYRITMTDGSTYDFTAPRGSTGQQGEQGEIGLTGLALINEITSSSEPTFNSTEVVAFANFNREPKINEGLTFFVYYNNVHYLVSGYISSVDNSTSTAVISIDNAVNIGVVISTAIVRTVQHESDTDVYSCNFMNNVINSFTAEVSQEKYIHFIEIKANNQSFQNIIRATYISNDETPYTASTTEEKDRFFNDIKNNNLKPLYIPSNYLTYRIVDTNKYYDFYIGINFDENGVYAITHIMIKIDNNDHITPGVGVQPPYRIILKSEITEITDTVSSVKGSN